jgi:uncharacterized membrane protein (UPF0127 family)
MPSRSWRCVAAALLALGACGGDDDAGETTVATSAAPVAPSVPASASTPTMPTTAPAAMPTTSPAPTSGAPTTEPTEPAAVTPVGFERVAARITAADGTTCDVCLWLADTSARRAQGLMGVTDLGGADGMLFTWPEPSTGSFWMRDTPMPLSIAFFAEDGTFVSAADMTPCLAPVPDAECARYPAAGSYTAAVEVPLGTLDEFAIGPGSRLEVLAAACPELGG